MKKSRLVRLIPLFVVALCAFALAGCGSKSADTGAAADAGASAAVDAGASAPADGGSGAYAEAEADSGAEAAVGAIQIVGAGDNPLAAVDYQDGACYYDFGTLASADLATGYPLAFAVNDEYGAPLASWTASIDSGDVDSFAYDGDTEYTNADGSTEHVFTVTYTDAAAPGNSALVLRITGTDASGGEVAGLFVATLSVE